MWAFLAVISRAFDHFDGAFMAPVIDLFNHHANPHAAVLVSELRCSQFCSFGVELRSEAFGDSDFYS